MAERDRIYDDKTEMHRVSGLSSQPAVYQDPDQPTYAKDWPDPDSQLHTVIPGSTAPPAVAQSGVDLGRAQPAPLEDIAISADGVAGHAANTEPAADDDGGDIDHAQGDLAAGETATEPPAGDEPPGHSTVIPEEGNQQ